MFKELMLVTNLSFSMAYGMESPDEAVPMNEDVRAPQRSLYDVIAQKCYVREVNNAALIPAIVRRSMALDRMDALIEKHRRDWDRKLEENFVEVEKRIERLFKEELK